MAAEFRLSLIHLLIRRTLTVCISQSGEDGGYAGAQREAKQKGRQHGDCHVKGGP